MRGAADAALDWRPLTAQQADFWQEAQAAGGHDEAGVVHLLRLRDDGTRPGGIDGAALARAIGQALAESDVLALRFALDPAGGLPQQAVDPARRPTLRRLDVRDRPDPEAAARDWVNAALAAPRDLGRAALSDHALIRLGAQDWLWAARGHHMILDGYAMALIEGRAARLYGGARDGSDSGAPLRPFVAYLDEETRYLASAQAVADRAAWREVMRAAPPLAQVPRGRSGPVPLEAEVALPRSLAAGLRRQARGFGIGWPDFLVLAAAAVLIDHPAVPAPHRLRPGQLTVWRAEMGRLGSVAAAVPALVVNLLPLPLLRGPGSPLGAFLRTGAQSLRHQRRHARWRFERLVEDLGIRAPARPLLSPLINVIPFAPPAFPGCHLDAEVLSAGPADGLTLTFRATPEGADLALGLEADPRLTSPAALAQLCDDLRRGLQAALDADPNG